MTSVNKIFISTQSCRYKTKLLIIWTKMRPVFNLVVLFVIVFLHSRIMHCDSLNKELNVIEEEANQIFNQFWQWRLKNNPLFATSVGVFLYDDRLNNMSLNSYIERADNIRMFLKRLNELKRVEGDQTLALNIRLLKEDMEQYLSGMKFKSYVWPVNNMEGPQVDYSNILSIMRNVTVDDMMNIVARMRLFPRQINEIISLMEEGIRLGLTMHKVSFEKLINVYDKMGNMKIESSPFFEPFTEKPKCIGDEKWESIVQVAKETIHTYINPSFRQLSVFIRDKYLPKSRTSISVSSLPRGKDHYRACLKFHTTTDLTPQEVHNIGLKEVARITARMEEVKKKVNFHDSLDNFRQYLRSNRIFGFKSEEDIMDHYKNIERNVTELLPKYFGLLPNISFVLTPIRKEIAPTAPIGYYRHPSPDGSRPGRFFVNTYKPESKRKYSALSLFVHEAIPGHHFQVALKIEHGSPLLFRRYAGMDGGYYEVPTRFAMNSALTEGWGLYAEYLGEEMGLYADPYDLFGRLSGEMLRACRLVVDTGMHALKWSRKKSIKFMRVNTAENLHDITTEVNRYITWPGQACAYKIGEMKIRELKLLASNMLGDKFDIRNFHDFILSTGNLPLKILEEQVRLFIKKELDVRKG